MESENVDLEIRIDVSRVWFLTFGNWFDSAGGGSRNTWVRFDHADQRPPRTS